MFLAFSLVSSSLVSGSPVNRSAAFLAGGAEMPHYLPHMTPLTSCSGRAPCHQAVVEALMPHSAPSVCMCMCVWWGWGAEGGSCGRPAVTTLVTSPAFSDTTLVGLWGVVTTGGLWVESSVCSVAFGRTIVVISKAFGLAGLPLSWISCSIWSRDLLGLFLVSACWCFWIC